MKSNSPDSKPRWETPEELWQLTDQFREDSNRYGRKFRGGRNKAKKAKLETGEGTEEEIRQFKALRRAYYNHRNLFRRAKKAEHARLHSLSPGEVERLENEQLGILRSDYLAYVAEFLTGWNKEERTKLEAAEGSNEEIERFQGLRKAHNAYKNIHARKLRRAKKARPELRQYEPEEVERVKALHKDYLTFQRDFVGKENKAEKARLESGQGSAEEIERFERLREAYRECVKVLQRRDRRGKQVQIEVDPEMVDDINQLETLREAYKTYLREFSRRRNEVERARQTRSRPGLQRRARTVSKA